MLYYYCCHYYYYLHVFLTCSINKPVKERNVIDLLICSNKTLVGLLNHFIGTWVLKTHPFPILLLAFWIKTNLLSMPSRAPSSGFAPPHTHRHTHTTSHSTPHSQPLSGRRGTASLKHHTPSICRTFLYVGFMCLGHLSDSYKRHLAMLGIKSHCL